MQSLKKVLIINPFTQGQGGAETFSQDLKKALEKKYEVHVATAPRYSGTWQGWPWFKAFKMLVVVFFSSLKKIMANKYERIYCLGLISSFIGFLFFWQKKNAIMLCMYDFRTWNPASIILNSFEKVFVEAGEPGAEEMRRIGVASKKIIKFTEWIDQTKFYPVEKNNARLQVLFVGRPIKIKGRHIIEEVEKELLGINFIAAVLVLVLSILFMA